MSAEIGFLWTNGSGNIELQFTQEQAESVPLSGAADAAIDDLMLDEEIIAQVRELSVEDVREELREYGAWDEEELSDHTSNVRRLIWLAAYQVREENGI